MHKEQLASVPNALSGRDSVDVIVHGMDGIPAEIIQEKLAKYQQRADGKATRKRERANWAQVGKQPHHNNTTIISSSNSSSSRSRKKEEEHQSISNNNISMSSNSIRCFMEFVAVL